jgi:GxxExxY protein
MMRGSRSGYEPLTQAVERLGRQIVDAAYRVHVALGPDLLESVYETCLCHELKERDLKFERQLTLPIRYCGVVIQERLRLDLLVEAAVICEIKAVESVPPVAVSQILTYLKLTDKRLGFIINFNVPLI